MTPLCAIAFSCASSSASKVVIVGPSSRENGDVDYRFGQAAIAQGLVDAPRDGIATVRIWQANIGANIISSWVIPTAGSTT